MPLYEIEEKDLESGMRGVPAGYCVTSSVDPQKGLFYMGKPVSELSHNSPEQVIYLLYHGYEGSNAEVQAFSQKLGKRAQCSTELLKAISALPKDGHPMDLFCMALQLMSIFECRGDYREDYLDLIAKIPQVAAAVINHHAGWKGKASDPELGYIENFVNMLGVPNLRKVMVNMLDAPDKTEHLTKVMRLFNVLHYDHGGGNLSCFSGKVVASGLANLYQSLSAAMNALAGPRHGKANQDCLQFVKEVNEKLNNEPSEEKVEALIRSKLENKELVYGFGHAVLRVEDPRATVQYDYAQKNFPEDPLIKTALMLRKVGPKVLSENPKITNPYPNVDAISGSLLSAAGFPYPEYFTLLFGLSRVVGIGMQIVYERLEARDGKGLPIIRPKYLYKARQTAQL